MFAPRFIIRPSVQTFILITSRIMIVMRVDPKRCDFANNMRMIMFRLCFSSTDETVPFHTLDTYTITPSQLTGKYEKATIAPVKVLLIYHGCQV